MPTRLVIALSLFATTTTSLLAPAAGPPPKAVSPADLLRRAEVAAGEIENRYERSNALAFIGLTYHKAGDQAGANRLMAQARKTAASIEEDTPQYQAAWFLMQMEVRRGNGRGALKACDLVENNSRRASLRRSVVHELVRNGDFKEAEKAAQRLKGDEQEAAHRSIALGRARELARAGKAADALREAPKFELWSHYEILKEVAFAHARAKQPDKARATLADARRIREKLWGDDAPPTQKARPLMEHALVQAESGDVAGALKTFAESKFEDDKGDQGSKAYYYWQLARHCVKAGDAKAATRFAEGLKNVSDRFVALGQVAKAQAEMNDRAGARTTLAKVRKLEAALPAGTTKDGAATVVAEVEMVLGDARAALAAARAAREGRHRGLALSVVGRVQMTTDRAAAARVLAEAAGELAAGGPTGQRFLSTILGRLAQSGGHARALSFVSTKMSPVLRARCLVAIAGGMIEAANAGGQKP